MSVNQNHWGAKPYQLAFVTTVLVAWGKAKWISIRLSLLIWIWTKKIGVCYTSHGTLHGSARKRQGSEAVRHEEDLLISSQPGVGYCTQASLITVLPVSYATICGVKRNFKKKNERKFRWVSADKDGPVDQAGGKRGGTGPSK